MNITNVERVKTLIELDQANSARAGHKKVQYRTETKEAAINLSESYQGEMRTLTEQLNIDLGMLYTWRYKAGLSNFQKRTTKKAVKKSPNSKLMERLRGQVEERQNDIVKLNKQLELVRLADELGMQIDFD